MAWAIALNTGQVHFEAQDVMEPDRLVCLSDARFEGRCRCSYGRRAGTAHVVSRTGGKAWTG